MSVPVQVTGKLIYPPDLGVPNDEIPLAFSGQFDSEVKDKLLLTGAGTKVLDLGTVPASGLKVLLLKVDPPAPSAIATPVNVRFNGGGASGQVEVAQGGFIMLTSPQPVAGITAVSILYTADATVRFWGLS